MIRSFTTSLKSLQTKLGFLILGIGLVVLSSCKKSETDTTPYSAITVINASPTAATYDVYLGDKKLNSAALPLGGSVAYTQQVVGTYDLKFTTAGRAESLLTKNVSLAQNTYQSFYLVGRPDAFESIFVSDDLSATSTTNAFVRFINLSPDAPALYLSITGGASVATNQTYKGISAFVPLAAGSYSFDIKDNVTSAVKTTLAGISLVANGYYTIIAKGLITPASGTEVPLSGQVIITR
ncbi:DUF4397 domain-containing protein [Pedobacter polaris]|uniref:DUF4397 domain-containing protein n=1 Tax=Pedobacter polaris TaxID=2571273 RepID=A0A4U1CV63_9SPHI|nr:DUF4397 domain-containing protein [Pedobacter polaris]TKC12546.1 DUF4397 domain-containing protein [Pedobacter polaris]